MTLKLVNNLIIFSTHRCMHF